ncbi:hypothetical protein ACFQ48_03070 [Hymenobacter caeli]|uniref:Uncharacterized protein n=1 Tax=Hymenobacter caeli TaxID=2735894 RepID=A0ABX2FMZ3_9BACT|nr:hypothetical protein [Hymenobacter caeli]NRT17807.1 hypothetical protein [Hymenobacter caeli]
MAALGIVMVYFIYAVLCLSALYGIKRWFKVKYPSEKLLALMQISVSAGLLLLLIGLRFYNHKKEENRFIGTYALTAYPQCPNCILHLKPNNQYEVHQGDLIRERGPWYYESGGDYWITHVGNAGQLGSGNFEYDSKANENGSQKHAE